MIEIHTHILPGIDDGSQSVEESLGILENMANSGIKKVVATPHFYPELSSIEEFLEKRQLSYEKIKENIPENIDVFLGAEVMLTYNLHKEELKKLAIQGTDYILIELPYGRWDAWIFDEIFKISAKHSLNVIIAHIDRYINIAKKEQIRTLVGMDLNFQVNIDDLRGIFHKSETIRFIKEGVADFVSSDCHNLTTRPPWLANALKIIKKRAGKGSVERLMDNAEKMLQNKSI